MTAETKAILLGLTGLSVIGLALYASKSPTLPAGPMPPQPLPPQPLPQQPPPRANEAPPPLGPTPAPSPPTNHTISIDSPSGASMAKNGDHLIINGVPPIFFIKADPPNALERIATNEYIFRGPGTTTVLWSVGNEQRSVVFQVV